MAGSRCGFANAEALFRQPMPAPAAAGSKGVLW
jgi:hypothetical protein